MRQRTKCASGSVVEHLLAKERVAGSSPVSRSSNLIFVTFVREWLSGGASPCQGEGRGFESRLALEKRKRTVSLIPFFFFSESNHGLEGSRSNVSTIFWLKIYLKEGILSIIWKSGFCQRLQ